MVTTFEKVGLLSLSRWQINKNRRDRRCELVALLKLRYSTDPIPGVRHLLLCIHAHAKVHSQNSIGSHLLANERWTFDEGTIDIIVIDYPDYQSQSVSQSFYFLGNPSISFFAFSLQSYTAFPYWKLVGIILQILPSLAEKSSWVCVKWTLWFLYKLKMTMLCTFLKLHAWSTNPVRPSSRTLSILHMTSCNGRTEGVSLKPEQRHCWLTLISHLK
jgi:hypothetical protein